MYGDQTLLVWRQQFEHTFKQKCKLHNTIVCVQSSTQLLESEFMWNTTEP